MKEKKITVTVFKRKEVGERDIRLAYNRKSTKFTVYANSLLSRIDRGDEYYSRNIELLVRLLIKQDDSFEVKGVGVQIARSFSSILDAPLFDYDDLEINAIGDILSHNEFSLYRGTESENTIGYWFLDIPLEAIRNKNYKLREQLPQKAKLELVTLYCLYLFELEQPTLLVEWIVDRKPINQFATNLVRLNKESSQVLSIGKDFSSSEILTCLKVLLERIEKKIHPF